VAICDQVEDPKQAKGLVRREVTRIVTPGTLTDAALLDPRESNYLAAIVPGETAGAFTGLAWAELSTGRFHAASLAPHQLADQLARIDPAECLLADDAQLPQAAVGHGMVTRRPPWRSTLPRPCKRSPANSAPPRWKVLDSSWAPVPIPPRAPKKQPMPRPSAPRARFSIISRKRKKSSLAHFDRLIPYRPGGTLELDESTRRSLELTRTLREGRREGSLLEALDRTVTAMGSRLLAEWLANPLTDLAAIDARLDAVAELVADPRLSDGLRERLQGIYDLERLLARVTTGRASPRDLAFRRADAGRAAGDQSQPRLPLERIMSGLDNDWTFVPKFARSSKGLLSTNARWPAAMAG